MADGDVTIILLAGGDNAKYVQQTLDECESLGHPLVLVARPDLNARGNFIRVPAGTKLFESVLAGVAACQTDMVITVCDLPNFDGVAFAKFIQQVSWSQTDVCIALADLSNGEATSQHPVVLAGQEFKFGGIGGLRHQAAARTMEIAKDILELRKQPVRLAFRLLKFFCSWRTLCGVCRYALTYSCFRWLGRWSLSFSQAEDLAYQLTRIRVKIILVPLALAVDDDRVEN